MKSLKVINHILKDLPKESLRWCEAEGGCCCNGCVIHLVTKEEFEAWKIKYDFCEHCKRHSAQ